MSDVWKFCQKLDEPLRRVKLFIKRTPQRKTFYQMLYPALPEDNSRCQHNTLSLNYNLVLLFISPFALSSSGATFFMFKWA